MSKPAAKGRSSRKPRPVTFETACRLALELPGVEVATSYRTPALKVKGKLFARLREDGVTLVLKLGFEERADLIAADPGTFFLTDHYLNYPTVLVRLPRIDEAKLRALIEHAWRRAAPPKLVAQLDHP